MWDDSRPDAPGPVSDLDWSPERARAFGERSLDLWMQLLAELRSLPAKRVSPDEIDLVMVPGVAFDRTGGRMGHGFGYYDKLLEHARHDAPLVALAFECQLFPEIPTQSHDIFMDKLITEASVYSGKGRAS